MFINSRITKPQLGDFNVCAISGTVGKLISLAEKLNGDAFTQYDHVRVYIGNNQIVQAEPGGAKVYDISGWDSSPVSLWSTGAISLTDTQRHSIASWAKVFAHHNIGYSEADYFALAAHRLHIPVPGLRDFINNTGHAICSQLVDKCYLNAGVHLFEDMRWPGYVTPADMAGIIERKMTHGA